MNFIQLLASCDSDLVTILSVVRAALNIITFIVPIVLIVLAVMDLFKAVTASDDGKASKEAQKRVINRVIYAVIIFLVPTIVSIIFNLLPSNVFSSNMNGYTWKDCWNQAK